MTDVAVIVASTGKNMDLARRCEEKLVQENQSVTFIDCVSLQLPLYTQKSHESEGTPQSVIDLTEQFKSCSKFIFVAPEYNGGIPPVLTNLIAWISVATEHWRDAFNGKSAAIATHSGSGGFHVLMGLRMQLAYLGLNVVGRQIHTHYNKELRDETLSDVVGELLK